MSSRTAIITGGAQGIGKATACRLLDDGISVVIADIDADAGSQAVEDLASHGTVHCFEADVAQEPMVVDLVQWTAKALGGIDILVNNAAASCGKPISDLAREEWDRVLAVALTGPMLCAKHCAPYLKRRGGAIVNIASTRAFMSEPNTEAYSAAKGGLVALTHSLAVSLGPEVRVNCISPGWIDTRDWRTEGAALPEQLTHEDHAQHPAGRVGRPEDIAALVSFLASDQSGFMTGANIIVDGGMTRKMIYAE